MGFTIVRVVNEGTAGFWSYVQADDEAEDGRIISLSKQLRGQFRLQTAEDLSLFVDRESLEWGAEWEARIDDAIAGTTFFIPVITPSFFKSQACRRELLKFSREAQRLGLEQLLLPVYWVTVPELEEDPENSPDEAIRLIARYQWRDLREARLEDESSSMFRKSVFGLASELATRAARVTSTVQDIPEEPLVATATDSTGDEEDDDDAPGMLEKVALSEEAMPEITNIMDELGRQIERINDLMLQSGEKMSAADARGQGTKAKLVLTERLARDLNGPTGEIEQLGLRYSERLNELDPGIHTLLDLAADPEVEDEEGGSEFVHVIQGLAESADETLGAFAEMMDGSRELAKFSRSLRAPLKRMRTGLQNVLDGRALIEEWGRRAQEIAEAGESDSVIDEREARIQKEPPAPDDEQASDQGTSAGSQPED